MLSLVRNPINHWEAERKKKTALFPSVTLGSRELSQMQAVCQSDHVSNEGLTLVGILGSRCSFPHDTCEMGCLCVPCELMG